MLTIKQIFHYQVMISKIYFFFSQMKKINK